MTAMETNYLIVTLIVLSSVYAVINFLIYQVKREAYLLAFTLSFVLLGLNYGLLAYQELMPAFFTYVVYNTVNFMSYTMILMGIRLIFNLKPVSRTTITITLTSLILIFLFSIIYNDYITRVIIVSVTIAFYFIEAMIHIKRAESKFPEEIKLDKVCQE